MIDIIIPVYNTQLDDLKRCLDSIVNQTYRDYKVYIIDDGSNKKTKEFLDNYKYDNFIIKHTSNNGISSARNLGIDLSSSKYITFVDSDDTIKRTFLEEAFKIIEDNNLDIIIGGYNEIKDNKISKTRLSLPGLHIYENENINNFLEKLLSSKTCERNTEIADCPVGRIYTRLFRRKSIGNLRFDTNIKMSEDTLFMIDYTKQAKKIGVIDKIWYNYYINDYSVSRGTNKEVLINNINGFIKEVEKRMNKENNQIIKNAYQARIDKAQRYIDRLKERLISCK